jgi:hypothetical protein
MQVPSRAHICAHTAYEKQSFSNPLRDYPPAPQEQSFALTRRRQCKVSPDRQESSRFCPRVFGQNRHFSQESALYWPQIRAPDWTYAGPGELRMQARGTHMRNIHVLELATILYAPPLRRKRASLSPALLPPFLGQILSESFSPFWALFTGKCTTDGRNPCAPLGL